MKKALRAPFLLSLSILLLISCKNEVKTILLNETGKVLLVGETLQLTATINASGDAGEFQVTWNSADKDIATVDGAGLVEAIAPGETTILANADDKTAQCALIIKEKNELLEITLNENQKYLKVGDTFLLQATIHSKRDPEEFSVAWSSDDETVATVTDAGLITALKSGFTTIVARSEDKNVVCNVFVSDVNQARFTQAMLKFEADPYARGKANAFILRLATENMNVNTFTGNGAAALIEFYTEMSTTDSLPTGLFTVVADFIPGIDGEYDKFLPNTISPGFMENGNKWGTWSVSNENSDPVAIVKGEAYVSKSAGMYTIAYNFYDVNENCYPGIYQGKLELGNSFNTAKRIK